MFFSIISIMALKVFIVFLVLASVSCNKNEICDKRYPDCKHPNPDVPGNQEELDSICVSVIGYLSCIKEYQVACHPEEEIWQAHLEYAIGSFETMCDKDGSIYKGLVRHLPCFKNAIKNITVTCREFEREVMGSVDLPEDDRSKISCLKDAVNIACTLEQIGMSCSLSAERTLLRVLNLFRNEIDFCDDETLEEVAELSEILRLEDSVQVRVLAVLDAFKEETSN